MLYYYCTHYKSRLHPGKAINVCLNKKKCKNIRVYSKLKKGQNTFITKIGGQTKN